MKRSRKRNQTLVFASLALPKNIAWLSPEMISHRDIYFGTDMVGRVLHCWTKDDEIEIIASIYNDAKNYKNIFEKMQFKKDINFAINYHYSADKNGNACTFRLQEVVLIIGDLNPDYKPGKIKIIF